MATSTVTDKGQTTVPLKVREALGVKPRQRLVWVIQGDGSAVVRPQPNAPELFGSLKPKHRAAARSAQPIASFDRDFDKLTDAVSVEPPR